MDDHVTYSRNIKRLLNENGLTLEMAAGRADIISLLFLLRICGEMTGRCADDHTPGRTLRGVCITYCVTKALPFNLSAKEKTMH